MAERGVYWAPFAEMEAVCVVCDEIRKLKEMS
jgi:hypothetical protein